MGLRSVLAVGAVIAGLAAITVFGEPFGRGAEAVGRGISAMLSPQVRPTLVPEFGLKIFGVEIGAPRPDTRVPTTPRFPVTWPWEARPEDRTMPGGAR